VKQIQIGRRSPLRDWRQSPRLLASEEDIAAYRAARDGNGAVPPRKVQPRAPKTGNDEADRRRNFAKAMARSAFGRHYWDEAKVAGLNRSPKGPDPRAGQRKNKGQ